MTLAKGSGAHRKQVNRWGRGGIRETGGRPMERDSGLIAKYPGVDLYAFARRIRLILLMNSRPMSDACYSRLRDLIRFDYVIAAQKMPYRT
jgi:hypothetical protein